MYRLVFLIVLLNSCVATDNDVCSVIDCSYIECPEIESCDNGYVKEHGDECGCCSVCVTYIDEGESCDTQEFLQHTAECKPGTKCNTDTNQCETKASEETEPDNEERTCAKERDEVLDRLQKSPHLLGLHPPVCDEDGTYTAKQCIESVCRCVDSKGNYLKDYKSRRSQAQEMHCKCAREEHSLKGLVGKSVNCQENGNYETKQCLGSQCYCTDEKDGSQIGDAVHISLHDTLEC